MGAVKRAEGGGGKIGLHKEREGQCCGLGPDGLRGEVWMEGGREGGRGGSRGWVCGGTVGGGVEEAPSSSPPSSCPSSSSFGWEARWWRLPEDQDKGGRE